MTERRNGTYVACNYSDESTSLLYKWMEIWKIPNQIPVKDLHSTILYSRVPLAEKNQINYDAAAMAKLRWKFLPVKVELLKSKLGPDALALIIHAPELEALHKELLSKGGTHDHATYLTHVSLSYDIPESFDTSKIIPPPVYLIPNKIYTEPLDCDWKA